ncbi:MAG: hypothetical protein IPP06_12195 [Saprospiraceae bacterium]|nr:hypothetical protein [Candidatus Vicinibacter affinis]
MEKLTLNSSRSFSRNQGPNELIEKFKLTELEYGKKLTMEVTTSIFYAHDASTYEAENYSTKATFHETLIARGLMGNIFLLY